jgi:hypothetical protein
MGISLKKLGRMLDPTIKENALGGLVRSAASAIPGGTAALAIGDEIAAKKAQAAREAKDAAQATKVDQQASGIVPTGQIGTGTTLAIVAAAVVILYVVLK